MLGSSLFCFDQNLGSYEQGLKKMPINKRFEVFILIAITSTLLSCATTNLPTIGKEGKAFQLEEDEQQIWQNAKQLERLIERSGILYKDEKLEAYLQEITTRLLPSNSQDSSFYPRIKVIQSPFLNAFALPNGAIYLHTGILARMENEAQLATLLGHEVTHFTHRHTVKEIRRAKNKETFFRLLQAVVAVAGAAYGGGQFGAALGQLTGHAGEIWTLASVMGYSRELETEADEEGFRAMVQAGYDPGEAVKLFQLLQEEMDEQKTKEPFFFGTHPRLQERIDNYRRFLSEQYLSQTKEVKLINSEEFLAQIGELLLDNSLLDLRIGRLKTAQAGIDKLLQRQPNCARAYYLLGEIHRRSGRDEFHVQRARTAYEEAIRFDPNYGDPHRELGLLYRAQDCHKEARVELERYLILCPKAVDANIIRGYLMEMEKP